MNKNKSITAMAMGLALSLTLTAPARADIVNNSHWLVKSGDTVYSIARQVYPGNSKLQARFRKELVKANPDIFRGNANLMSVGSKLNLPASVIKSRKVVPENRIASPVKRPAPRPKLKPIQAPVMVAKAVTPDPTDDVGKVVISMGKLEATNRGATRPLTRNSRILKGDTLRTAHNTHTQIRFKDGALVALRPDTEFHISDYNYNGAEDGTERGIFELIKGGFRTITGAIGHRNKQNYRVNTTVATIGIRGTHYGLMLCADGSCQNNENANLQDGLYGGVVDGAVVANNDNGEFRFDNDQYFHIESAATNPVEVLIPPPVFEDTQPQPTEAGLATSQDAEQFQRDVNGHTPPPAFATGEVTKPLLPLILSEQSDQIIAPIRPAPSGSGMMVAFTQDLAPLAGFSNVSAPVNVSDTNNNAIFLMDLPEGPTVPVGAHEEGPISSHEIALGTATIVPSSLGGDPLGVNWGRWQGNFVATEDGVPLAHTQNLHFIYSDKITDPATLSNLGNLGGIFGSPVNYSSTTTSGTLATDQLGVTATSVASVNMVADFQNNLITSYTVSTNFGGLTYDGQATNIAFTALNQDFALIGSTCSTCTGAASLQFVGPQAEGAITSYAISDTTNAISGTALLKR